MSRLLSLCTTILCLTGIFDNPLQASHTAGGEITYTHVGPTLNDYLIELTLMRREAGINLGPTQTVQVNSSCFPSQSIIFSSPPGSPQDQNIPNLFDCIDSSAIQTLDNYTYFKYQALVNLPGTCSDWIFSWEQCCRPSNSTNLASFPSSYIEAKLNNTLGPNNSPQFESIGGRYFCINEEVTWYAQMSEVNGDSVYVDLVPPRSSAINAITFNPGFTASNPFSTANGIAISNTGNLSFTASVPDEIAAFTMRYREFRFDSATLQWILVGEVFRDMQLSTVACSSQTVGSNSNAINLRIEGDSTNALAQIPCKSGVLSLVSDVSILCQSLDPMGTDFVIYNSLGQYIPIFKVEIDSCSSETTKRAEIFLAQPINYDDTLSLVVRKGNDLNTLIDLCGREYPEFDTLQFYVNDCNSGISLHENNLINIDIWPNPVEESLKFSWPKLDHKAQAHIYDQLGQLVWRKTGLENINRADLSHLATGLYTLQITGLKNHSIKKFQKL